MDSTDCRIVHDTPPPRVCVRDEQEDDAEAVRAVVTEAFGRVLEANAVDALRRAGQTPVSLVAVDESSGRIVGHVLFSPVTLVEPTPLSPVPPPPSSSSSSSPPPSSSSSSSSPPSPPPHLLGLAPLAVVSDFQRRGIGSLLMQEGLERCRKMGCDAVFVVGHPSYYPRFGFQSAYPLGFGWEGMPEDASDEQRAAVMVRELVPGFLHKQQGRPFRFRPELID